MDTKRKIINNSLSIYFAKGVNLVLTFFIFVSIANRLGSIEFGKLSIAIAYIGMWDILANFGINQIIVRELSADRYKREQVIAAGIVLKTAVTAAAVLLSALGLVLLRYPKDVSFASLIVAGGLVISSKLSSTRTIFETLFQADLRMFYPMAFSILDNVLFAVLYFASPHITMIRTALLYTLANLPGFVLVVLFFLRTIKPDFSACRKLCSLLFYESIPIAVFLFFSIMTTKLDIILLSRMAEESHVGIYSAATRLVYPLMFLSTSFTLSLFPLLSYYIEKDKETFTKIFLIGTKTIFFLSLALCVPLSFNARWLINTLYIEQYSAAVGAFRILALALGLSFFNFYFVDVFIAVKKQRILSWILGISLVINLLLNLLFIPKFNFIGSSYARLLSAAATFMMFTVSLSRNLGIRKLLSERMLLMAFLFAAGQFFLSKIPPLPNLFGSLLLFAGLAYGLRVLSSNEIDMLLSLFRVRKSPAAVK